MPHFQLSPLLFHHHSCVRVGYTCSHNPSWEARCWKGARKPSEVVCHHRSSKLTCSDVYQCVHTIHVSYHTYYTFLSSRTTMLSRAASTLAVYPVRTEHINHLCYDRLRIDTSLHETPIYQLCECVGYEVTVMRRWNWQVIWLGRNIDGYRSQRFQGGCKWERPRPACALTESAELKPPETEQSA